MTILLNEKPLMVFPLFRQVGNVIEYKRFPADYMWRPFLDLGAVNRFTGYGRVFGDEFVAGGVATQALYFNSAFPYTYLAIFSGLGGIAAGFIGLRAGLYRIKAQIAVGTTSPIVTVKMNDIELATDLDLYADPGSFENVFTYEDVVVANDGDQVFSIGITDKNELSPGYDVAITKVNFWRTGDLP